MAGEKHIHMAHLKEEGLCVMLGNPKLNSLNIATVQRKEMTSSITVEIRL